MNDAKFHLMVNHLPIIGGMIAVSILIGGYIFKSAHTKRVSLFVLIFSGITAVLANISGEGAERMVEDIEGVSHRVIHHHEEWAEKFFIFSIVIGVLSCVTLFLDLKNKKYFKFFYIAILVLMLVNVFLGFKTGTSGGEVRHTEIVEAKP